MLIPLNLAFGPDHVGVAIWFWFSLLLTLGWLRRHGEINQAADELTLTDDWAEKGDQPLPALTVLVAAKDEEANIGRCVEGLLAQDYPNLQVIAINDRSDDRTGAILDEIAARDARLEPVHVQSLPAGWFGKNNAMREGMLRAKGAWLCFTDADCAYDSTKLLRAALRVAQEKKAEMLSALPTLEARSFWERVVQPVAGGVMVYWYPPRKVNNPKAPHAYANGAFMLMPRETYDALGGHDSVRATLNEDMHFARLAKANGKRLLVIRAGDMFRVHMYSGWRQIWRGWSRIFYGCFGTLRHLLGSVAMLLVFSLSPWIALLVAPWIGADGKWLAGAAGIAILAQQSVLWRFYGLTGNGAAWAVTYPLGAAACLAITCNAIGRLFGGSTNWRGATYVGGAQVSGGGRVSA